MTVRGGRGVERSSGFVGRGERTGGIMTRTEEVDNWRVESRKIPFNPPISTRGEVMSGVDRMGVREDKPFAPVREGRRDPFWSGYKSRIEGMQHSKVSVRPEEQARRGPTSWRDSVE